MCNLGRKLHAGPIRRSEPAGWAAELLCGPWPGRLGSDWWRRNHSTVRPDHRPQGARPGPKSSLEKAISGKPAKLVLTPLTAGGISVE